MDLNRQRFLRDRVLTATPAQRVVMLYDRLALDLRRGRTALDAVDAAYAGEVGKHIDHAFQIVAELLGSLDSTAGGPADNLGRIYNFLLRELVQVQLGQTAKLDHLIGIVDSLRVAWVSVADGTADVIPASQPVAAVTGIGWTA